MLRRIDWWRVKNFPRDRSAFILNVKQSKNSPHLGLFTSQNGVTCQKPWIVSNMAVATESTEWWNQPSGTGDTAKVLVHSKGSPSGIFNGQSDTVACPFVNIFFKPVNYYSTEAPY
jgi:hypothetical protein